jgi:uncharacterized protein (TIGR00255 family)
MIRSMTGFGHGAAAVAGWRVEATLRSVNHRYLSIRLRSLSDRPWLQSQIEEKVRAAQAAVGFDRDAARRVVRSLEGARAEFGLSEPLTLADLIRAGGLQAPQEVEEALWPAVEAALAEALRGLDATRSQEGHLLGVEIGRLLDVLEARGTQAEARLPGIQDDLRNKLRARIDELGLRVDADRIESEIVLCVDRFDVQEELVRLRGHIARVRQLLSRGGGPVGKELDFLSQELLREVNTLGSKVRDGEVAGLTVDMKVAIEQLKEQVQNVE